MNLTQRIMGFINGSRYIALNGTLADYHVAQAVKAALRRKSYQRRLLGIQEALKQFRIKVTIGECGGVELRRADGQSLIL